MPRPHHRVSALITTRNRAAMLDRCLQALARQEIPPGVEAEVIVVDNGSTDETPDVVRSHQQSGFPVSLRMVREEEAGRSRALNAGFAASEADLVFLIDDDAFARPDWLAQTWEAFHLHDADLVGGRLVPPPRVEFPRWWRRPEYDGIVAVLDWGDEPRELNGDLPYGANVAFRADTVRHLGGFDLRLGRTGTSLLAGEDHDMGRRILHSGGTGIYWPASVCEHQVRAERLTRNYCRRWKWGAGRSGYHLMYPHSLRRTLGVPRFLLGELARHGSRFAKTALVGPRERLFERELAVWGALGALREATGGWKQVGARARLAPIPRPTISAVIPAHDAEETIEEALRSILEGEVVPDEIIVVDDRSRDRTAEIARSVDPRVRVEPSRAPGPSAARNTGIALARGEWIAFLDADDLWLPHRLSTQLRALEASPEVALVVSHMNFFDDRGREWPARAHFPEPYAPGFYLDRVLRDNFVHTQTVFARRRVLDKVGGFDESMTRSEDLDLWSRIMMEHPVVACPEVVARKRLHERSLSSDFEAMFAAQQTVVARRLDELPWSDAQKSRVRVGLERWLHSNRAWLRVQAGDDAGARDDLWPLVRARPWALRHLWLLFLTYVPRRGRESLRGAVRMLRGREMSS